MRPSAVYKTDILPPNHTLRCRLGPALKRQILRNGETITIHEVSLMKCPPQILDSYRNKQEKLEMIVQESKY